MAATSIVFKQLTQREKIGEFEKRLCNKTKETEVNIFLAKKKKNWRRNKEKRNNIGTPSEKNRCREKIKHHECSTVIRCSIIIFCIVIEVQFCVKASKVWS